MKLKIFTEKDKIDKPVYLAFHQYDDGVVAVNALDEKGNVRSTLLRISPFGYSLAKFVSEGLGFKVDVLGRLRSMGDF